MAVLPLLELDFHFNIIAVTETRIYNDILDFNRNIPNYNFEFFPTPLSAGGVGMYIDETMNYTVIERTSNEAFQALWMELQFVKQSNIICGVIYKQHNSVERFLDYFEEAVDRYSAICLLGDVNINILRAQTCNYAEQFLDCLQSYALLPTIDKATRVYNNSAHLSIISSQLSSPKTLLAGTLFPISLIISLNSAYFSLLL